MKKLLLIVRSNMRKAKGQTVAIVVLILLAATLLNLWLMLAMDYRANFDRYHDKLNAQHVTLSVNDADGSAREYLSEALGSDDRVEQFELKDCLSMTGTFNYNGGEVNGWFVILPRQAALTRSVGKAEITKEGGFTSGVYLPMLYESEGIEIGKPIEITIGGHTVGYMVCGFFNSIMAGTHNCYLTELILSEDKYSELELLKYAPKSTVCSVRLSDKSVNRNFEAELGSLVSAEFPDAYIMTNNYNDVIRARYISQMICSGIISAMAFIVLLIAVVVIVSNILNYIQINMKNLGVLKAVGYTSRQLIRSLLLQFLGVSLLTALVGAGLSYALFPAINSMMIAQTGVPYAVRFLPLPLIIALLILGGTVALAVCFSARRIKRIEPIVALRSGVQTHNFKRNRVPLERTKAPLNFALALKTALSGVKHNLTVCVTMLVLSLIVVFSGLMTANVIVDMQPFIDLIVGETPDNCINVNIEAEDEFLSYANDDKRVEKVYLYSSFNVTHVGGIGLFATVSDDFSKVNNKSIVFKGRFPRYENEIALAAKYAGEKKFKIGAEIELSAGGNTEKYLICGLTQSSNQLGRDCLMTREGYERLSVILNVSYYMNLTEGADIDAFNGEMKDRFSTDVNMVINGRAAIESMATVYVSLMTVIVIAVLVLSVIIIAFVLFFLVRTLLNNKMRDYGIMKSLGFTTGQLVLQTALSFMPAVIISTAVGLVVSSLVINPLTALFLSGIGVVKCTFKVPVGFIAAAGAGLILFAFAFACLLSLRIKKISPRTLIAGE